MDNFTYSSVIGDPGYPNISARLDAVCQLFVEVSSTTCTPMTELVDMFTARLRSAPEAGPLVAAEQAVAMTAGVVVEGVALGETLGTVEERVEVWAREGVDAAHVVNELIVAESLNHLGLVHHERRKLRSRLPDAFEDGDLVGYGWRGLRMALRQYDPRRGYRFSSFACPKINGAIRDGVRNEGHLPKRLTTLSRKVDAASAQLAASLTRAPTFDEIADWLELTADQRRYLPLLPPPKALDADPVAADFLLSSASDVSVENVVESRAQSQAVADAVAELGGSAGDVVRALFVTGATVKSVADAMGVSQRVVRSLRDDGLAQLREQLADWAVA